MAAHGHVLSCLLSPHLAQLRQAVSGSFLITHLAVSVTHLMQDFHSNVSRQALVFLLY